MERDFLGINGKDLGTMVKEGKEGCEDPAFIGVPAVQSPFSNKFSALQQFMSFKSGQDERTRKIVFDQLSSPGFRPVASVDTFDVNNKVYPVQAPQKFFSAVDSQGAHQFTMQPYQSQSPTSSGSSLRRLNESRILPLAMHPSIPVATSHPFYKVHGSPNNPNLTATNSKFPSFGGIVPNTPSIGPVGGAFTPKWNASKSSPLTAQLTIFYAGSVNVYDDVPLDKAQAIMFLASKGSNAPSNAVDARPEVPLPLVKVAAVESISMNQAKTQSQTQTQTAYHVASPCSCMSSPISVTSHSVAHSVSVSVSGCSTGDDTLGGKNGDAIAPTSQPEPSNTPTAALGSAAAAHVGPRAIPQARKASLARFLEKRKERVTSNTPYSNSKKFPENEIAVVFNG